jgi:uncharacterized protein (DUF433 family)
MKMEGIEVHPDVCIGRPVLRGTRITVESVLGMLAAGDPVDEVLRAYPSLSREQVLECLEYAAKLMHNQFSFQPL